eukprot:TRINITY_DN9746_c0_g1_i3.p1 TRINITY_DN9746_c0_g1~~TRINITY_DN9746_c0_g1_i3.p1  ORF type:complete len:415 (+),score=94.07 TRINITY_DN9746_c0_g1_i3:8-1252(+)
MSFLLSVWFLLQSLVIGLCAYAGCVKGLFSRHPSLLRLWMGQMVVGLLGSELALHLFIYPLISMFVFTMLGATDTWLGVLGWWVSVVTMVVLLHNFLKGLVSTHEIMSAAKQLHVPPPTPALPIGSPVPPNALSFSFWTRILGVVTQTHYPHVRRARDVSYGTHAMHKLDVLYLDDAHLPHGRQTKRPVVLYVHGGGWQEVPSTKGNHGLPFVYHMANQGWIIFTVDYRLSPTHKMPAHIDDVKLAVTWVKQNAHKYSGDPNFVTIAGGSAGGHLASLAALTSFTEKQDERIPNTQCCVSIYGVYDFTDRNNIWTVKFVPMLEKLIMTDTLQRNPQIYKDVSPLEYLHCEEDRHKVLGVHVPFLLTHGTHDGIVPIQEAYHFRKTWNEVVRDKKLIMVEFPGGHHAFDALQSPR